MVKNVYVLCSETRSKIVKLKWRINVGQHREKNSENLIRIILWAKLNSRNEILFYTGLPLLQHTHLKESVIILLIGLLLESVQTVLRRSWRLIKNMSVKTHILVEESKLTIRMFMQRESFLIFNIFPGIWIRILNNQLLLWRKKYG